MRVLTDEHTDTHTNGTDFIPSTADAGGKNRLSAHYKFVRAQAK